MSTDSQVWHIIDAGCSPQEVLEASLLAGGPDKLVCVGPPPSDREAIWSMARQKWLELPKWRSMNMPWHAGDYSRPQQEFFESLRDDALGCCWSISAVGALTENRPTELRLVLRLSRSTTAHELGPLRALEDRQPTLVCPTPALAEVARAAAHQAGLPVRVKVAPPPAMPLPNRAQLRRAGRKKLGLAEGDILIFAPGPVDQQSHHRMAVWAMAVLWAAQLPAKIVFQDTGLGARQVHSWADEAHFGPQTLLAGVDLSLPELMASADVATFLDARYAVGTPLATALSAGLPVVAGNFPVVGDWLQDEQNALLVEPDQPRRIARGLLRLIENADLRAKVSQGAMQFHHSLPFW